MARVGVGVRFRVSVRIRIRLKLGLGLGILINLRSDFYCHANTKNLPKWRYLRPQEHRAKIKHNTINSIPAYIQIMSLLYLLVFMKQHQRLCQ